MNTLIYDFETLSQEPVDGVAVCFAFMTYDENRLSSNNPYEYEELLELAELIKFNVEEQVEIYNRKIESDTLIWWKGQSPEARKILNPSEDDVSITELPDILLSKVNFGNLKKAYTRGNTFDPIMLRWLHKNVGKTDPTPWWIVRDTRSMIEGLSFGTNLKNNFVPEGLEDKFVAHDAKHDIVMDVMRMQVLTQALKD